MVRYTRDEICRIADEIRNKYCETDNIPVDVEFLWEIALGREIRPIRGLGNRGTEAMLFGDLKVIAVDDAKYNNDAYYRRIRFSIAHEIGHYFLHCGGETCLRLKVVNEWFEYYNKLDDDEYRWLEWHANEFAGRLLVPVEHLKRATAESWNRLPDHLDKELIKNSEAVDYFAKRINTPFEVSSDVIARRLRSEKLWPPD